ncbi:MAG: hypothetical protein IJ936_05125 [Peptococcaceae bacterium]|nr:hypothetical protein [Peptococcaceae bacterium]
MKTKKRNYLIIALIVLLLALAIGYAAFSDSLTISGTANAKGTFDMEFTSAKIDTETAKGIDTANSSATISTDKNTVSVTIKDLAYPGAGTNVTVVAKNNGTVPAKLTGLTFDGIDDADIEVTFPDGLAVDEVLQPGGTCTITFSVKWKKTSELKTEKSLDFSAKLDYSQETVEFTGTPAHTDA